MNSKAFTFLSFIPAFAYWYLEANYDLKTALIGGMILSVMEMTVEKIFTKHLHAFSKLNFFLVVGLGSLSLIAQDGIWFKLQPTIGSIVMGVLFAFKSGKGESFLHEMALTTSGERKTLPLPLFKQLEKHLSLFLFIYAFIMAILAFASNTSWWLFGKTGGFYILFFLFIAVEFYLIRKKIKEGPLFHRIEKVFTQDFFKGSTWTVVSINSHYFLHKEKNFILEWHFPQGKQIIGIEATGPFPRKLEWQGKLFEIESLAEWMMICNRLVHFSLKDICERFQRDVVLPLKSKDIPGDEERSWQWLLTSLRVLKDALNKKVDGMQGLLQSMIFGGLNPEDHRKTLRVVCFNLDFFLFFHDDGKLQLTVYDDKDGGVGASCAPAIKALFVSKRADVLQEMIQLIILIGEKIESNISVNQKIEPN